MIRFLHEIININAQSVELLGVRFGDAGIVKPGRHSKSFIKHTVLKITAETFVTKLSLHLRAVNWENKQQQKLLCRSNIYFYQLADM